MRFKLKTTYYDSMINYHLSQKLKLLGNDHLTIIPRQLNSLVHIQQKNKKSTPSTLHLIFLSCAYYVMTKLTNFFVFKE